MASLQLQMVIPVSCGLWAYSCTVGAIPLDCTSSPVDTSPVGERLTAAAGDALWAEPHVHSPSEIGRAHV